MGVTKRRDIYYLMTVTQKTLDCGKLLLLVVLEVNTGISYKILSDGFLIRRTVHEFNKIENPVIVFFIECFIENCLFLLIGESS